MNIKLKTKRLSLKPIALTDLQKVHELHSFPETDKFNTLGIPESLDQTHKIVEDWVEKNSTMKNFTFKVELIESKSFVGLIALNLGKPKYKIAEV